MTLLLGLVKSKHAKHIFLRAETMGKLGSDNLSQVFEQKISSLLVHVSLM